MLTILDHSQMISLVKKQVSMCHLNANTLHTKPTWLCQVPYSILEQTTSVYSVQMLFWYCIILVVVLYQDAGDFASTAFFILKPRCPDRGTLKIQDINSLLDDLANGHASKDKALVRRALGRLLR